jgi:phosphoglycerate dehydrogenase-like enzyme
VGEIVVNMGRFGAGMVPQLEALLPGERVVPWPADGELEDPEVLATLAIAREDVEAAILPSIRWVHVLGAGVDGIPLDAIGDRVLTCSKGASSVPIAEYVLAVLLAHEKQLPEQWLSAPPPAWNAPQGGSLGGLAGTTMALVGVGAIGTEVARRALAFGVRVLAHRRSAAPMPLDGIEAAPSLEAALREADHVVVTAPSTPQTYHLIGEESLAWVKPGAHLVNIARGPLVDTDALLAALDDGRLAKASLDVAEGEPLAEGHPLYAHPKVRLTPHLSWSSSRTGPRTIEMFVENLARWRAGEPLAGIVDPTVGY